MTHIKALLVVLATMVKCFAIGLALVVLMARINPLELPNMLFPQTHKLTTIEAVSHASEFFQLDYEDCNQEIVCTLAIGLNPDDSYVTPILQTIGITDNQAHFVLTFVVDTFELYQG